MSDHSINNISPFKFESKPVRVIRVGGQPMLAVVDVANAIGADRSALLRIINRNKDTFEGYYAVIMTAQLATRKNKPYVQKRETMMVNQEGLIALLLMVADKRIKDPSARAKVVAFKRWAIRTISKVLSGEYEYQPEASGNVSDIDQIIFGLLPIKNSEAVTILSEKYNRSRGIIYTWIAARRTELGMPPPRKPRSGRSKPYTHWVKMQVNDLVNNALN